MCIPICSRPHRRGEPRLWTVRSVFCKTNRARNDQNTILTNSGQTADKTENPVKQNSEIGFVKPISEQKAGLSDRI